MLNLAHITERDASEGYEGPVPVLQRRWEFAQLLTLYRHRAPLRVLEVGTYHGGTLYHWLAEAAAGATVVSVDSPPDGVNRAHFQSWVPSRVSLVLLTGDSRDPDTIVGASRFGPFDWIFLDAGHAEYEVSDDWANYSAMAAPGAVVALHDILPGRGAQAWIEVDRLWCRLQRQGYVTQEIVASEHVDWGGVGIVYL